MSARRAPRFKVRRLRPHSWLVTDRMTGRRVKCKSERLARLWITATNLFRLEFKED